MKKTALLLALMLLSIWAQTRCQNLEKLHIEPILDNPLPVIISDARCKPGFIRIEVYSDLPDLRLESSMVPDSSIFIDFDARQNLYRICHPKMKFQLKAYGPKYERTYYELFDLKDEYRLRIKGTAVKGTIKVNTIPDNATIILMDYKDSRSSADTLTLQTGQYRVTITKPYYESLDTILVVNSGYSTAKIELKPKFALLKLDVRPQDRTEFYKPFNLWIDSMPVDIRALSNKDVKPRSFDQGIQFNELYEGNVVPVETEGSHHWKLEAPGYQSEQGLFNAVNGRTYQLSQNLRPMTGYLTVRDEGNAENAKVFIDDRHLIGNVPFSNKPVTAGKHVIMIEKDGYIATQTYEVEISPDEPKQLMVSMELFRNFTFKTEPIKAEIHLNNKFTDKFTNDSMPIPAGHHEIRLVKSGYATELFNIQVNEKTPLNNEVTKVLKPNYPLQIRYEGKNLYQLNIQGRKPLDHLVINAGDGVSGKEYLLPYGKYKLTLQSGGNVFYKGLHTHSETLYPRVKLPVYSKNSFRPLGFDFYDQNNFDLSLGQSLLFGGSGLTTSIVNLHYLYTDLQRFDVNGIPFSETVAMIIPSVFLLNWDLRIGGALFEYLEISALGKFKYSPGLKFTGINIYGFNDASVFAGFYGVELSTRLPYVNLNFRIGRQIMDGKVNFWAGEFGRYSEEEAQFDIDQTVVSLGMTINGPIYKTNNMIRIWNRPLANELIRKLAKKFH